MRRPQSQRAAALPQEIERIKSLDLNGLEVQWRNVFGKRAPSSLPRALIVKILIYRLQADVFGEVDAQLARLLEVYAARGTAVTDLGGESAKTPERAASEALTIKPGSVLVRDWGGRTHRVMALEVGFAWEGRNYRSLSEVARAITGTRWNGRRFFGVGQKAEAPLTVSKGRQGTDRSSALTDGGIK